MLVAAGAIEGAGRAGPPDCGLTTLQGTIVPGPDGPLGCGPGFKLVVRDDLAAPQRGDNQQYNELRWIIDLFDGGALVDPDSGADGYDGVQNSFRNESSPELLSPVAGEDILDLANEPFRALPCCRTLWLTSVGAQDQQFLRDRHRHVLRRSPTSSLSCPLR